MSVSIFISYAWADDTVPEAFKKDEERKGFVTFLHRQLNYELDHLDKVGRPKFWRDIKHIEKYQNFEHPLDEGLDEADILLIVFSPNWLGSPNCQNELTKFSDRWEQVEGVRAARDRIVLVSKHFVEREKRPLQLQGKQGYDFFTLDADNQGEEEFFYHGKIAAEEYWKEVRGLGRDLLKLARKIENVAPPPELPAPPPTDSGAQPLRRDLAQRVVYVAKTARDMEAHYKRLVMELRARGFGVVPDPDTRIPNDVKAPHFVDDALAHADISIHLLGEGNGYQPDDGIPHIVPLQLARAAEHAVRSDGTEWPFYRIIWAPRAIEATAISPALSGRDPLKVLEQRDRHLPSDKIEGDSISRFIDFLIAHLDRTTKPPKQPFESELGHGKRVYVYYREEDAHSLSEPLYQHLYEHDIDLVFPAFEGDIDAHHRASMRDCDGIILVWAGAPYPWVQATIREWESPPKLGRTSKFAVRALVAAPPPGKTKAQILKFPPRREIDIIIDLTKLVVSDDGDLTPPPEVFDPLIKAVRPTAR